MKKKMVLIVLLTILYSSCIEKILGHKYVEKIDNARISLKESYTINGLFEHFPKSISNKSFIDMLATIPGNIYYPDSYHSGFFYLILNMGEDSLSLYPKTYIYKTKYTNRNFIIDDSFSYYKHTDTLKLRNTMLRGAYPIPYFEIFDFGLGSERFDLRPQGMLMVIDKYYVPEDLDVYVLKASHGYFWKKKFNLDRPETLGEWKNGYSCGIAISKKNNMIIYWMKVW
jgi:hypothetical protein